ncbi:hypothetical protein VX037_03435 [Gordonia sp. Z-3]|uniref:hypothetical protein n=1 Tax=unclassified Gordonia (in: high G+C Gram-positive bacteria) TaxID=2657482 RepID=UPI000C427867|nr:MULTISPECIES: hypothetical protein [unclassified Gordonia (in: high G+C Gram-positive bacteria)]MAU83352.1 hypothetical protein [Gordonia sp. (in: high G+C Gram-positive bacteria)]MED5800081.1 hypothetical protein [Gordonia sp. Z-3]
MSLKSRLSALAVGSAAVAIAISAAPALAAPQDSVFGSAGSSGSGSAGSSDLLDAGSSALGSSGDKIEHYGKLGRDNAPNGVRSINVWVYAPNTQPISPGVYPRNSRLGVRYNSTIDAGPVVDGDECAMQIRLSGPKVPKKAQLFSTQDCTSVKPYTLRAPGSYSISVTDTISGASNAITFDVQ